MVEHKNNEILDTVEFHYIKSNLFRVIHTDGVLANITPKGKISLCLFSERTPIPKLVEYSIDQEGHLSSENNRVSRSGFVREIDTDMMIDIETAKEIKAVLETLIKKYEEEIGS